MTFELSIPMSGVIMVSLTYGICVVAFPSMVKVLGVVIFLVSLTYIEGLLCFYVLLQKDSTLKVMSILHKENMLKDPYLVISEVALGARSVPFVRFIFYVYFVANTMGFQVSAATVMTNFINIDVSNSIAIRIWLLIVVLISLPFMMKEMYSNMVLPAILTLSTSFIAMVCISTISLIARYYYDVKPLDTLPPTNDAASTMSVFVVFGVLVTAAAGIPSAIPNIVVLLKSHKHFDKSIYASHLILISVYIISAMVPYTVFGERVHTNIIATLFEFLKIHDSRFCRFLLAIAQICLGVHFTLVAVLQINPVFLSLEEYFNIPHGFSWKRCILRTMFLSGMLSVCCIIPYFEPMLALFGGGPAFFFIVLFHTMFYWKLIPSSCCMKMLLELFLGTVALLCTAITFYSIEAIVDAFKKDSLWSIG